jgi:DNA-binding MarR family transcriptional regulator
MAKLQHELKKANAFASKEQEVFLNVMRTAEALAEGMDSVLKPAGLSSTQYNVLRILRGAEACCGETGLACREIGERMVTRDPDITRLLDRMEKAGLIVRERAKKDRRVIKTAVTEAGLKVLAELDGPVMEMHEKQLGHMGEGKLSKLSELLEEAREKREDVKRKT